MGIRCRGGVGRVFEANGFVVFCFLGLNKCVDLLHRISEFSDSGYVCLEAGVEVFGGSTIFGFTWLTRGFGLMREVFWIFGYQVGVGLEPGRGVVGWSWRCRGFVI